MTTALALRNARALAPSTAIGSGTTVLTPSGGVSAVFALASYDRRQGVAIYALQIVNRSRSALVCRIWVVKRDGDATLAYPVLFEIKPLSTMSTEVPVWARDYDSFHRAVAEVVGEDVHCIVESAPPVVTKSNRAYGIVAAATFFAGMLALGAAGVLRTQVPRIGAFAVPPMALAGTTVQAEYGIFGAGKLSYSVTAPDGHRLQGGTLSERSGSIPIAIPASKNSGAYTVQMVMQGLLGSAKEVRVLNTVPAKASGVAAIEDLSVDPVVAKPGQRVNVAYSASGQRGYLRLLGGDGTIWAQQPFSRDGESAFVIPPLPGGRELRVLLHVEKGRSAAESSAGLVVAGASSVPSTDGNASSQIASDDDPDGASAAGSDANGTFNVITRRVPSGAPIRIQIISPRNAMRISLTDMQSREVAGKNIGADATTVTLQAPQVSVATRYTVVASFTDGFGQESIVQPITVLP
jgi:hypothetical protein